MRAEYNNLRAALSWIVIEREDTVAALCLTGALPWYLVFRRTVQRGTRLDQPRARIAGRRGADRRPRKGAVRGERVWQFYAGALDEAIALASESVALFRAVGDRPGLALALFHLGIPKEYSRKVARALWACFKEAAECFRELGDEWGTALAVTYHGVSLSFPGRDPKTRRACS